MTILKYGHASLGKESGDVVHLDDYIFELVDRMVVEMHQNDGVGLAAPQVGLNKRIFVWTWEGSEGVAINPTLELLGTSSAHRETAVEGCLSAPGAAVPVERFTKVRLEATNLSGEAFQVDAEGYLARIFQHEIDHLDGRCIMDLMNREGRRNLVRQLRRS